MNKNNFNITENIQFRLFLVFVGLLLIFKLFIAESDLILYRLVSDFLLLAVMTFLFLSLIVLLERKKVSPISLIMNIGILNAESLDYHSENWWKTSSGVRAVLNETLAYIYVKFFFYPKEKNT